MIKRLPNDLVLLISGVSCVGKTTTAYSIINQCREFKVVTELDIIRTVIRETITNISDQYKYFDSEIILKDYSDLFDSLTDGDFDTLLRQSKTLLPYIKKIIYRQQDKKIPTIIEGISIVPELCFENFAPIEGFKNNIVFINLYISNKDEHIRRRFQRCRERRYDTPENIAKEKVEKMWDKNVMLHISTEIISLHNKNVYSLDITNMSEKEVSKKILSILYHLSS